MVVRLPIMLDVPEEDYTVLRPVFHIAICDILRLDATIPCVFVLDALDESLALARSGGMQRLFRQLAQLVVPTVLTMRTEFWRDRLSDFGTLYGNIISVPGRCPKLKRVVLYELLNWDNKQIILLAKRYRDSLQDTEQRTNISELISVFSSGNYESLYGDIPRRPLFLRFILETVATHGPHTATRVSLFNEWTIAKIRRDIEAPTKFGGMRIPISSENAGSDEIVSVAYKAMEIAACEMVQVCGKCVELKPTCELGAVVRRLGECGVHVEASGIILNTLLLPVSSRLPGQDLTVRFAHRTFQEYFLARCIVKKQIDLSEDNIPKDVIEWLEAIRYHDKQSITDSVVF